MIRKFFVITALLFINFLSNAQETTDTVDMADTMRSNGKIYVVVAVLLIILFGLIIFLIRIDRKVSRLEKKQEKNI